MPALQREAGESVPCVRDLMRGDLPDQRVKKAASKKAPSDSAYQCMAQTGASFLRGSPAKTALCREVKASGTYL